MSDRDAKELPSGSHTDTGPMPRKSFCFKLKRNPQNLKYILFYIQLKEEMDLERLSVGFFKQT